MGVAGQGLKNTRMLIANSLEMPGSHKTLVQCWVNAGPSSWTLAQHYSNIGPPSRVC